MYSFHWFSILFSYSRREINICGYVSAIFMLVMTSLYHWLLLCLGISLVLYKCSKLVKMQIKLNDERFWIEKLEQKHLLLYMEVV